MLWKGIFASSAIFLIAAINYFGLMIYVLLALLALCGPSFGPLFYGYAYTRLSPIYPIGWKYILLSGALVLTAVLYYFNLIVFVSYGLFMAGGTLYGPDLFSYVHSILSPNSSNGKTTKKKINKFDSFQALLLVSPKRYYFLSILYKS